MPFIQGDFMGTENKASPYRFWSTAKLKEHQQLITAELISREPIQTALETEARIAARDIPGTDGQPPAVLMDFRDLELPPRSPRKVSTQFWPLRLFQKRA